MAQPEGPEVLGAITQVLRVANDDLAHELSRAGVTPAVMVERMAIRAEPTGGWRGGYERVSANTFSEMPRYDALPYFRRVERSTWRELADLLAAHPAAHLPFWSFSPGAPGDSRGGAFDEDAGGWVLDLVVRPAIWSYLCRVPAVGDDAGLASIVAREAWGLVTDSVLRWTTSLHLAGPVVEEELVAGTLTVRPLSPTERGDYVLDLNAHRRTRMGFRIDQVPTIAVDIRTIGKRDEQSDDTRSELRSVIAALALCAVDFGGPRYAQVVADPSWRESAVSGTPLQIRGFPRRTSLLTRELVDDVAKVAASIAHLSLQEPVTREELAVHRLTSGYHREADVDALLDFVVTLESLLLPYDEDTRRADLSLRFRLHGAVWLAETVDDRYAAMRQLREIYDARSRSVHGVDRVRRAASQKQNLTSLVDAARELATQGVRKALHHGFPDASEFTALLLSGSSG